MITDDTFSSCGQFFKGFSCSLEMAVKSGVLALLHSLFLISGEVFSDIISLNDDCLVKIKFLSLFRNVVLLSQSTNKWES